MLYRQNYSGPARKNTRRLLLTVTRALSRGRDRFTSSLGGMLVLHLDVNKTLIMTDKSSGKITISSMVNSLLSEAVWGSITPGTVKESRTVEDWKLESSEPSATNPDPQGCWVTFGQFVEEHTALSKAVFKPLKQSFTELGGIGERCRGHYDALMAALAVPTIGTAETSDSSVDCHFILPSVFHLFAELSRRNVPHAVVFRTFGHDTDEFAADWNLFVAGQHPTFPLAQPLPHLSLSLPRHRAALFRSGTPCGLDENVAFRHCDYATGAETDTRGMSEMREILLAKLSEHRALFVQDHYDFWAQHHESDVSGKLLVLSPEECDGAGVGVRQLFVDDNIERHRAHIVDVRKLEICAGAGAGAGAGPCPGPESDPPSYSHKSTPIGFSEAAPFLLRAEPVLAILHRDYFVRELETRGLI